MAYFDQTKLRAEIVKAAAFIRDTTGGDNDSRLGSFTMTIEVKGSLDKTDAKLKFAFDFSRYYGNHVSSPRLDEALAEILRRMDFDEVHKAELLTYDADEAAKIERLQQPVPAAPEPRDPF